MKKNIFVFIVFFILLLVILFLVNNGIYKFANVLDSFHFYKQEEFILKNNLKISKILNKKTYNASEKAALNHILIFYKKQKAYSNLEKLYLEYINNDRKEMVLSILALQPELNTLNVYNDLGKIYLLKGDYVSARKNFEKAIDYKQQVLSKKTESLYKINFYNDFLGLSEYYLLTDNPDKAKFYIDKSANEINNLNKNYSEKVNYLFNIYLQYSNYYKYLKNYEQAEIYAEKLFVNIPNNILPVSSVLKYNNYFYNIALENMINLQIKQNKYEKALFYAKKKLDIDKELYIDDYTLQVCGYYNLAEIYRLLDDEPKYEINKKVVNSMNKNLIIFEAMDDIERYNKMSFFCKN